MTPRDLLAAVHGRRRPAACAGSVLEERMGRPVVPFAPGSATVTGTVHVPLGPLAARPAGVSRTDALRMLAEAVAGLPVDSGDRSLLARAEAHWDPADVVILASLLARARSEGPASVAAEAVEASAEPVTGPACGWGVTCGPCGSQPVPGPVTQGLAELAARHHDIDAHEGLWCAEPVPVASPVTLAGGAR